MYDGIPLSSSDTAMISKRKKNCRDTFKFQMKKHFLYLKTQDDELFKNILKISAFVLKPLKAMLNDVVDIIYIQQLEYEIESVDITNDYNF